MRIKPADAVAFFGFRGSGKTVAARHLLRLAADAANQVRHPTYQIFILYTKPEINNPFARRFFPGSTYTHLKSLEHVLRPKSRIVVVEPKWHEKNEEGFSWFFEQLYWRSSKKRKPQTVFVDETNSVTGGRSNGGPLHFKLGFTEGRGMNYGMWAGVQDAMFVQREMLSEINHLLVFWTRQASDRKKLSDALDYDLPSRYPDPHGLVYAGQMEAAAYFRDIQSATGIDVIL